MNVLTISTSAMLVKCAAAGMVAGMVLGCLVGLSIAYEIADRRRREQERRRQSEERHKPEHGFYKGSLYLHNDHLKDEF